MEEIELPKSNRWEDNYENYVKRVFTLGYDASKITKSADWANTPATVNEEFLPNADKYAKKLAGIGSDSPLDNMYKLYDKYGLSDKPYKEFEVYQPKTSSEYHSILNKNKPGIYETSSMQYNKAPQTKSSSWSPSMPPMASYDTDRYKVDTSRYQPPIDRSKHWIIDSSPQYESSSCLYKQLSEYLYPGYNYIRKNDSRYVGSDFVMYTTRHPDAWFDRVDKLLEEARKTSIYY